MCFVTAPHAAELPRIITSAVYTRATLGTDFMMPRWWRKQHPFAAEILVAPKTTHQTRIDNAREEHARNVYFIGRSQVSL